jgi:hypothetical protein
VLTPYATAMHNDTAYCLYSQPRRVANSAIGLFSSSIRLPRTSDLRPAPGMPAKGYAAILTSFFLEFIEYLTHSLVSAFRCITFNRLLLPRHVLSAHIPIFVLAARGTLPTTSIIPLWHQCSAFLPLEAVYPSPAFFPLPSSSAYFFVSSSKYGVYLRVFQGVRIYGFLVVYALCVRFFSW